MTTRFPQRKGFTFIECLVVMFTIILLATIIFPGLKHKKNEKQDLNPDMPEFGTPPAPSEPATPGSPDATPAPAENP